MKLRITNNALDNVEEILFYIEFVEYSPANAEKVKQKILRTIKNNIHKHPLSYKVCEEIPTKTKIYRKALCFPFWIIYKVKSFEIIILAIIHTSRAPNKIRALRKIKE